MVAARLGDVEAHAESKPSPCRSQSSQLETFLGALQRREQSAIERGTLTPGNILSDKMRKNWENRQFWIDYAVRRSWAFDAVFWTFIDTRFFGGNGKGDQCEERLTLLDAEVRDNIDAFVQKKVEEAQKRELKNHGELSEEYLYSKLGEH